VSYAERTKRPPKTLTDREVAQILKTTGEAKAGFRDHVIISLALGCALRESEIVALDVIPDVSDDGLKPKRIIQLRTFKRAGRGEGSEASFQRVHVPDATYYKLQKYLKSQWRDRRPSEGTPLFMSRQGGRISGRMVRKMWHKWQVRAGFEHRYPFHTLRHTSISKLRASTGDIRLAQRLARHVNIATTARYDHPSDEELARAVKGLPG